MNSIVKDNNSTLMKNGENSLSVLSLAISVIIIGVGAKKCYEIYRANKKTVTEENHKQKNVGDISVNLSFEESVDVHFPWDIIKRNIQGKIDCSDDFFASFINTLTCKVYSDRVLVGVPQEKVRRRFIDEKYKKIIEKAIYEVTGKAYAVSVIKPGEFIVRVEP